MAAAATDRRAVRRLATARTLSALGSQAAGIALSAQVYRDTGSAVWLSAAFFLTFGITGFLSPLAGMIADRFDRKRVMVTCDLLGAFVWSLLLVPATPVWLLAIGFTAAVVSMPFYAAADAAIPNMVAPEDLSWANSLIALARKLGSLLGPALGGGMMALVGPRPVYLLNAVSFVVSASLVATVRARFSEDRPSGERAEGMMAGFRHIFADPVLRSLFIVWTVLFLTIDVAVVADLPLSDELGWGAFGYGLLNTAWGAGAVVGAIFARRYTRRMEPWAVLIGAIGIGVGYLVTGFAPIFGVALIGQFIASATDTSDEVAGTSIIQRRTHDEIRGRVFSAVVGAGLVANAIGFSVAGFVIEAFGPRVVYVAAGLASVAVTPLLVPMFRGIRAESILGSSTQV